MRTPTRKTDLQRVAEGIRRDQAAYHEAVVQMVGDIDKRVTEMQREIRLGELESHGLKTEVTGLADQIGQLRDLVTHRNADHAKEAARATLEEVRPVMAAEAVKVARTARKLNPTQIGALIGIGFISLVQFIEKGPAVAKAVIVFVKGLADLK